MRGEHVFALTSVALSLGSSPHARGAQLQRVPRRARRGIIPACAGSTYRTPRCMGPRRDHPRMRGEHPSTARPAPTLSGSSPHARGARAARPCASSSCRIIPACAGSTRELLRRVAGVRDHPRMRGEHRPEELRGQWAQGSSPHARGAPLPAPGRHLLPGIIPACAGSTVIASSVRLRGWDHPRMRGEHSISASVYGPPLGSSPHARGAPAGAYGGTWERGIIPACAGSTSGRRL